MNLKDLFTGKKKNNNCCTTQIVRDYSPASDKQSTSANAKNPSSKSEDCCDNRD